METLIILAVETFFSNCKLWVQRWARHYVDQGCNETEIVKLALKHVSIANINSIIESITYNPLI